MEIAARQPVDDAKKRRFSPAVALTLVYAVVAAALITLRALVDDVDFLSTGWILLLAAVPLLPWLLPAIPSVLERTAPFVKGIKLPGVELTLRDAERPVTSLGTVERVLTEDHLVGQALTGSATPFTTTDAMTVIQGVQEVRSTGAEAVVVNLANGRKWRLPNLYFLAWLLHYDPVTQWLVLTEMRRTTEGCFVGICSAADLCARIQAVHAEYAAAAADLEYFDPTNQQNTQQLADQFNKIRSAIAPAQAGEDAPTLAWVETADLHNLLGPSLATESVDWTEQLDRPGLEAIVRSAAPYVAATTPDGRFRGLVDQRQVALEFARRALSAN